MATSTLLRRSTTLAAGMMMTLLFYGKILAQAHFPAASAQWYHHMAYGSYYGYTDGDTVIQGQLARIIRQKARVQPKWAEQGLEIDDLRTLAVFTRSDTSFIYNPYFRRFTPLYVFNASPGDSLCLPLIDPGGGRAFFGDWGDSTFCFIIDSIKPVLYDQHLLRTYFTRSYRKNNTLELNWGPPESGAYVDRLGGLYTGFLPQCVPNAQCLSFGTNRRQPAEQLRCYEDNHYKIRRTTEDCAHGGRASSLRPRPGRPGLRPWPNPVLDKLYWEPGPSPLARLDILPIHGQRARQIIRPVSPIDVRDLPGGQYILLFQFMDGSVQRYRTLIIGNP